MLEKRALFRGGDEELGSPFTFRRQRDRGEKVRGTSVDLWRRMSVSLGRGYEGIAPRDR